MRRGEDKQTCINIYFAYIILLYPMSLAGRGDKMKVKEKKGSMWKLKRGEKKRGEERRGEERRQWGVFAN